MKTISVIVSGIALAALLVGPSLGCAAAGAVVGPSCVAVKLADEVCEVLVPIVGSDGRVTYVHIPAAELRQSAAARLAASSSAAAVLAAPAGSR